MLKCCGSLGRDVKPYDCSVRQAASLKVYKTHHCPKKYIYRQAKGVSYLCFPLHWLPKFWPLFRAGLLDWAGIIPWLAVEGGGGAVPTCSQVPSQLLARPPHPAGLGRKWEEQERKLLVQNKDREIAHQLLSQAKQTWLGEFNLFIAN